MVRRCRRSQKFVYARDRESFCAAVPQAKVELQRQRQFGIEMVTPPFPSGLANQRRHVIHRMPIPAVQRLVTKPESDVERHRNLFAREQQIQIVLRSQARSVHEGGSVSESLERNELESRGLKRPSSLAMRQLRSPPALCVVDEVLIENVRHPSWQTIVTTHRERNRQLRTVAKVDQLAPLAFLQAAERGKTRRREMQSIEDRLRVEGNMPGRSHNARPTASKTSDL